MKINGIDTGGLKSIFPQLTVAGFQAPTATGTATNPTNINDNNIGTHTTFDAVNEYVEVDFGMLVLISQYRQYGNVCQ